MSIKDTLSKAMDRIKSMTTRKPVTAEDKYKADTYRQLVVEYVNKHLDRGPWGGDVDLKDTQLLYGIAERAGKMYAIAGTTAYELPSFTALI